VALETPSPSHGGPSPEISKKRDAVATKVKRLIIESGRSRQEFASRIGTSGSRLSTYATGKVVPSAALMLPMRTVGKLRPKPKATSSPGT
jgi:DNA-binding transcriptional regulator YiaG